MTEHNFGAGIGLNPNWDLEVDSTGDIATVSGREELEKDISMLAAIRLSDQLGTTFSARRDENTFKSVEMTVERLLRGDPRITDIQGDVEAREHPSFEDTVVIDVSVIANPNQDYDLILEVSP